MAPGIRLRLAGLLLFIAGCAVQPEKATEAGIPFDPAAMGEPSHRVDAANSRVILYIYRAGAMPKLGHNHIVLARGIRGEAWLSEQAADSAFHLVLPVASFSVDPPQLRARAGEDFSSEPSATDVDGTRRNMLGEKVLNAAQYPEIEIWSERIRVSGERLTADIVVAVRGARRRISAPVEIDAATEGELTASGKFSVRQTELGLTPFSILMGMIAVRDELEIEYTITVESDSGIKGVLGAE